MPPATASAAIGPPTPRKITPPDRPAAKRPPRAPQVVRNPNSDLAITDIDWTAWYLTEEDDIGESWTHANISSMFEDLLKRWLAERDDPTGRVGRNVFLQWVPGQPLVQISPDAFVVQSAPEPLPNSVQTWLPGHYPPRFALEVVSDDWRKDYHDNPPKYAHMGCRELNARASNRSKSQFGWDCTQFGHST